MGTATDRILEILADGEWHGGGEITRVSRCNSNIRLYRLEKYGIVEQKKSETYHCV